MLKDEAYSIVEHCTRWLTSQRLCVGWLGGCDGGFATPRSGVQIIDKAATQNWTYKHSQRAGASRSLSPSHRQAAECCGWL